MKYLVTGAAGFIGFHTATRLLDQGNTVVGLDNLSDYCPVALKEARLARLQERGESRLVRLAVEGSGPAGELFAREKVDRVIHLAAQAGVRYSLLNPYAYIDSNLTGFT